MTTFDQRKDAFENRFAHDEELKFKAYSRRNRALGHWAAGMLGKSGEAVDAYVAEIIGAELHQGGDEDVFAKLRSDFNAAGVSQSDHQIRRTMDELMAQAVADIKSKG